MGEMVAYIVKSLADHPEEIEISERMEKQTVIIDLKVAPDDMGKVIGKHGRIANAIRAVMRAAASRQNKKIVIEISDKTEIN